MCVFDGERKTNIHQQKLIILLPNYAFNLPEMSVREIVLFVCMFNFNHKKRKEKEFIAGMDGGV